MAEDLTARLVKRRLQSVSHAYQRSATASVALRKAIVEASQAGATQEQIAKRAGLSRGRVSQILAEEARKA